MLVDMLVSEFKSEADIFRLIYKPVWLQGFPFVYQHWYQLLEPYFSRLSFSGKALWVMSDVFWSELNPNYMGVSKWRLKHHQKNFL